MVKYLGARVELGSLLSGDSVAHDRTASMDQHHSVDRDIGVLSGTGIPRPGG